MLSNSKIWTIAGALLVVAMLSLSVCINACTDIAPVSTACPHHQENSDCCKHPNGDSAALSWNPQKQHPHIMTIAAVSMESPVAVSPMIETLHSSQFTIAKYHDSSGPSSSRILSLRI